MRRAKLYFFTVLSMSVACVILMVVGILLSPGGVCGCGPDPMSLTAISVDSNNHWDPSTPAPTDFREETHRPVGGNF